MTSGETDRKAGLGAGGFTLLELLVAAAIVATILVLAYKTVESTAETMRRVSAEADVQHLARVIYARLADELIAADWEQGNARTVFVGGDGMRDGRPADTLRFSSRAHVRTQPDAPESDLNVVAYELEGGTLVRREERNPMSLSDRSVETEEFARGVAGFNLRYWSGSEWRETWDAARANALPAAVLVELALMDPLEGERRFLTTVRLSRVRADAPPAGRP